MRCPFSLFLFIQLFCLYYYGLVDLYFIPGIIIPYYCYLFLLLLLFQVEPLKVLSGCLWAFPRKVNTSLLSGSTRCFGVISWFPYASPRISHFCKKLVTFIGECIGNQDLGARCAHCYCDVTAFRPSWERKPINMCTSPHKYTHIYFYIYLCIFF